MNAAEAAASGRSLRTVCVRNLGCKVNRVESEHLTSALLGRDIPLVAEEHADVVVINTCTVTGEADGKARKAVRHALAGPREPIVVVTGCLASLDAGSLAKLGSRVVVQADKELLAATVSELVGAANVPGLRAGAHERGPVARVGGAFRSRVMLKIQDGCDSQCAYCIVPQARGGARSTPLAALRDEAEQLVAAGAAEIVLTGINLGRYVDGDAVLADVVSAVADVGAERIRLSSIEPLDLTDALLDRLASTPGVAPHLHVPLQSGSDRVLAAMGRGYDTATFAERIHVARQELPGLAVTTDVIAGFPQESSQDAEDTLRFVSEIGFSRLHVFRYSARRNTKAALMSGQVDPAERAARARALRDLDRELRSVHARARLGQAVHVLVEEVRPRDDGGVESVGTSEDYLRVRFAGDPADAGRIIEVRIVGAAERELVAERLSGNGKYP